jgi:hypothetical protein
LQFSPWIRKLNGVVLRNETRVNAETLLSVVEFDQFISATIYGLVGPRANMQAYVRFGSEADMCAAKGHVRFAPNSDRESGFPQTVMSALPPKADIRAAKTNVR